MPLMIHDNPWLLLVFAGIGFVMTWLMLPGGRSHGSERIHDSSSGSFEPNNDAPSERRREAGRAEERLRRERMRRARLGEERSGPTDLPEWCVVLGVSEDVDRTALRRAYVAAVKNVHPDCIGPDCPNVSETCAHLAEAYALGREHLGTRA